MISFSLIIKNGFFSYRFRGYGNDRNKHRSQHERNIGTSSCQSTISAAVATKIAKARDDLSVINATRSSFASRTINEEHAFEHSLNVRIYC